MQPASTRLAWLVSGTLGVVLVMIIVAPIPAPRAAPVQAAPARDTTTPSQAAAALVTAYDRALADSVVTATSPAYRVTIDSTFDKFEDDAPRVYVRLSRLRTSMPGLSLRLVHARCARELMSDERNPGHTVFVEIDSPYLPKLVPLARRGALWGTLEYAAPGRNGTWDHLIYSRVVEGSDGGTYISLFQRYVSERYVREFLLDTPGISFRLSINGSPGLQFTVPESAQGAVRAFLAAAREADTSC